MKPPAFQFYPDDFLSGTVTMSPDEVGFYIRLLCWQWNRGSIPVQPDRLARLAGGPVSEEVLSKFPECPDGLRRNPRLEAERAKQDAFRELQRNKGIASGRARGTGGEPNPNRGSTAAQPNGQPNANSPSPSSPFRERDKREREKPTTTIPTVEEVIGAGVELAAPESWCRQWYREMKVAGWADRNGVDIGNWRSWLVKGWGMHRARPVDSKTEKPERGEIQF